MTIVKDHWQNPYDTSETLEDLWALFVIRMRNLGFDSQIVFGYILTQVRETALNNDDIHDVKKANNFSYLLDIPYEEEALLEYLLQGNLIHKDPIAFHVKTFGHNRSGRILPSFRPQRKTKH